MEKTVKAYVTAIFHKLAAKARSSRTMVAKLVKRLSPRRPSI